MKIALRKSFTDKTSTVYITPDESNVNAALPMLWREVGKIDTPFFVKVNGKIVLRAHWNDPIPSEAFVEVYSAPGVTTLAVVSIVLTVVSLAVTALLIATLPETPNANTTTSGDADNVFSFSGQSNLTKLNQCVETSFGTNKWFPPYLTLPRIYFVNNKAYIDILFSLGTGTLQVDEVRCGDTLISDIANSSYTHFDKGTVLTGYDCVYIGDKTNVELSPPDSENFEIIRTIVTPVNALSKVIQLNFECPSGLTGTVGVEWRYRKISNSGDGISAWSPWRLRSFTASSSTAQRFTLTYDNLESARYEIAVQRSTNTPTTSIRLLSAYGLGNSGQQTSVQSLRVSLEGSNSIDQSSASDISVITTRHLRTSFASSTLSPSRNSVWAIVNLLIEAGIPIADLDSAYWTELAASVNNDFDFVYVNKTTVWQALQDICGTFRGQMFVIGSDFRVAIDAPDAIPSAFFGPDNAIDLTWNVLFQQEDANDCVVVTYVDPKTGLQTEVQFTPPGSLGVNPQNVTVPGVTDRTSAWRIAAYKWMCQNLLRDTVSFTVGLDGLIPMYGDVVTVAWPFPAWAVAGLVNYQDTNGELVLTEDLPTPEGASWLSLRTLTGEMYGPIGCTIGSAPNRVILDTPLPVGMFDFEDFTRESVMFTFGTSTTMEKPFRITSLAYDGNTVKVDAVAYDTAVFTYDTVTAPDNDKTPVASPGVSWAITKTVSSGYYRIVWPSVEGATSYAVKYVYLDTTDPNWLLYAGAPAMYPNWSTANDANCFGTSAYIPTPSAPKPLMVRITASTGAVAYWRGMTDGTPLVISMPPSSVANVVQSATGSFNYTADKENTELIAKVDPAIGSSCDLRYTMLVGSEPMSLTVPVNDLGYATITSEDIRRLGMNVLGTERKLQVLQNGSVKLEGVLNVTAQTVAEGLDHYISVASDIKIIPLDLPTSLFSSKYMYRRITVQLNSVLKNRNLITFKIARTFEGYDRVTIYNMGTSDTASVDLPAFATYRMTDINRVTRIVTLSGTSWPNYGTGFRAVVLDWSASVQIRPTVDYFEGGTFYIRYDNGQAYLCVMDTIGRITTLQNSDWDNITENGSVSAVYIMNLEAPTPITSSFAKVSATVTNDFGQVSVPTAELTIT